MTEYAPARRELDDQDAERWFKAQCDLAQTLAMAERGEWRPRAWAYLVREYAKAMMQDLPPRWTTSRYLAQLMQSQQKEWA